MQLELPVRNPFEPDRNFHLGGRSFYFFDIDDNIFRCFTPAYLFHKTHGHEKEITQAEFMDYMKHLKANTLHESSWSDFEINLCERTGTFRHFRDLELPWWKKLIGIEQAFVKEMKRMLSNSKEDWKGPSWKFFWYAVHNNRPLSLITARGHHPETIQRGFHVLHKKGELTRIPNFLSVYPVSHKEVRRSLGDIEFSLDVPKLKKEAIRNSVKLAFEKYGQNPHHRFGMSDDDPHNLDLIVEAMRELKREYPENSFYVFNTFGGQVRRLEISLTSEKNGFLSDLQLTLL